MMQKGPNKMNEHDCTVACVKMMGQKYVLAAGDKVYQIENQSFTGLDKDASMSVNVTGQLSTDGSEPDDTDASMRTAIEFSSRLSWGAKLRGPSELPRFCLRQPHRLILHRWDLCDLPFLVGEHTVEDSARPFHLGVATLERRSRRGIAGVGPVRCEIPSRHRSLPRGRWLGVE